MGQSCINGDLSIAMFDYQKAHDSSMTVDSMILIQSY